MAASVTAPLMERSDELRNVLDERPGAETPGEEWVMAKLVDRTRALEEQLIQLARENLKLRELAHHDALTGLNNLRGFRTQLAQAISLANRHGGSVSVLMIDLDGMKHLNDTQGHPAGDIGLRGVGGILNSSVRRSDMAARLGGDEFGVLMPQTQMRSAKEVAERIRARVEELPIPGNCRLSASIGIATYRAIPGRDADEAAEELLARADEALYAAKNRGRNRVEVHADGELEAA